MEAKEAQMLFQQGRGMVDGMPERHNDCGIRKEMPEVLYSRDVQIVFRQIPGLATVLPAPQPDNLLHMATKEVLEFGMRLVPPWRNPVREVVFLPKCLPQDFFEGFWAIQVDEDAIAMGALRGLSGSLEMAGELLPEARDQHKGHIPITVRGELAKGGATLQQKRCAGSWKGRNEYGAIRSTADPALCAKSLFHVG
jgi:hypothetical protein